MTSSIAPKYQIANENDLKLMPDGYVVYQEGEEQVHYLNPTASLVLALCSAKLTAEEISLYLGAKFDLPDMPVTEVEKCLEDLVGKGLITPC